MCAVGPSPSGPAGRWRVVGRTGMLRAVPGDLQRLFERVPEGWSLVVHDGRRYGVTRTTRNGRRSMSVYAEELGGSDVVSANLYCTSAGERHRPCEMPEAKVLAFLRGLEPADER